MLLCMMNEVLDAHLHAEESLAMRMMEQRVVTCFDHKDLDLQLV